MFMMIDHEEHEGHEVWVAIADNCNECAVRHQVFCFLFSSVLFVVFVVKKQH